MIAFGSISTVSWEYLNHHVFDLTCIGCIAYDWSKSFREVFRRYHRKWVNIKKLLPKCPFLIITVSSFQRYSENISTVLHRIQNLNYVRRSTHWSLLNIFLRAVLRSSYGPRTYYQTVHIWTSEWAVFDGILIISWIRCVGFKIQNVHHVALTKSSNLVNKLFWKGRLDQDVACNMSIFDARNLLFFNGTRKISQQLYVGIKPYGASYSHYHTVAAECLEAFLTNAYRPRGFYQNVYYDSRQRDIFNVILQISQQLYVVFKIQIDHHVELFKCFQTRFHKLFRTVCED